MRNRYKEALDVQDACNPSGVARLFYDLACEFHRSPEYTGTDSVRNDPALRLIAYKLCELMGHCASLSEAFEAAEKACIEKEQESKQ
jgi:hypothetical protein